MTEFSKSPARADRSLEERDRLFKESWKLVVFVLGKHFRTKDRHLKEDLMQEGAAALWRATVDWDPAIAKFSTYACKIIWSRMKRFCEVHYSFWYMARRPDRQKTKGLMTLCESTLASEEDGFSPMNSVACERAVRDFERMESSELYEVLMERLSCYVPMRTVQILERRFCREETVREVGAAFGVSGSRIQQIEARGLERARKEFNKMFREEPAGGWVEKERKDGVTELKPARREETMAPSFGSWGWLPGKGLVLLAPAEAVVAPC